MEDLLGASNCISVELLLTKKTKSSAGGVEVWLGESRHENIMKMQGDGNML